MPRVVDAVPVRYRSRSKSDDTGLWWLSLGLSAVVVGVVATLLNRIAAAAKDIDEHATAIWVEGKKIAGNTVSIWMLGKTNEQVARMLDAARAIERNTAAMGESLRSLARSNGKTG